MIKGGIYYGKFCYFAKDYVHPIICLSDNPLDEGLYNAAIITHDNKKRNIRTIAMKKEHFQEQDLITRKKYKIQFENSRLVIKGFEKITAKTNGKLQGMLSEKGLKFVEKNLQNENFSQDNRPIWIINESLK